MNTITEPKLKVLGFKKTNVPAEESGDNPYYYFTKEIKGMCLITNASNECVKDKWVVEIFEYPLIRFKNYGDLYDFIYVLKSLKK